MAASPTIAPLSRRKRGLHAGALLAAFLIPFAGARAQVVPPAGADQGESAFHAWMSRKPGRREEVRAFLAFLEREGVRGALPSFQVLRTDENWRACRAEPFAVPPRTLWPNIVPTLRFIRKRVRPRLPRLEVLSGYRDAALNRCAGGAPQSAHVSFRALDLTIAPGMDRNGLFEKLCDIQRHVGRKDHIGLGLYMRTRFHVDSMGFRDWGPDAHGPSSPCKAPEVDPR